MEERLTKPEISMPGQKISEADRKKINPKFICTVCGLLLSMPMQTSCGHLLCYVCLQTLLSSSNPTCPSDGTPLRKEDVNPDMFTKREIMALQLHCPNEGCDWSGTNKDLQEHSNHCNHALIQCVHTQCNKEIERALLAQHLQTECLYREVTCDHCKKKLAFNLLEQHVNVECTEVPLTCEHCGRTGLLRREMEQHKTDECAEIPVECEFKVIGCNHAKMLKRQLRQHSKDALSIHVHLLLKTILDLFPKVQNMIPKPELATTLRAEQEKLQQLTRSLSTEITSSAEKSSAMLRTLTALQKRVENVEKGVGGSGTNSSTTVELRTLETRLADICSKYDDISNRNGRLEVEMREKDAEITRVRERLDRAEASMAETTVRLSDMGDPSQAQATTSCNGTLLWRIDDFGRKRRDGVSGNQIAIYSPHFYSSQYGYKMCARIYMNGDGFGKNTHISLFFVVMKGEYDALLPWPFQKKITMMLLDQNNAEHNIDAFRSDPESTSFQRPTNNMNVASGSPLFMPLDGLNNRTYVKDDTMFIKIIVD